MQLHKYFDWYNEYQNFNQTFNIKLFLCVCVQSLYGMEIWCIIFLVFCTVGTYLCLPNYDQIALELDAPL